MSDRDDKITDMRARIQRLADLLADPRPGLHTWGRAYQDAGREDGNDTSSRKLLEK